MPGRVARLDKPRCPSRVWCRRPPARHERGAGRTPVGRYASRLGWMGRFVAPPLVLVVIGAMACASSTQPQPQPTLLVRNATCDTGPCITLQVRVFVWGFHLPEPIEGFEVLGYVPSRSACFVFPSSWTIHVTSIDSTGQRRTIDFTATPDTEGIYLVAEDSSVRYGDSTRIANWWSHRQDWPYDGWAWGGVGHTATFRPGTSPGWSITFPSMLPNGAPASGLAPAEPCSQ